MPTRVEIQAEIDKLETELQRIKSSAGGVGNQAVRDSDGKFLPPFKETALKLAKLYLELKDNVKAAECYADLIDNSSELRISGFHVHQENQRSLIKADMYRKLGLFTEAEKIYTSIISATYFVGTSSDTGNIIRDQLIDFAFALGIVEDTYPSSGYKHNYISALYGLGNTYRDQAAANKNKAKAEQENTAAIKCYLSCAKAASSISVYNFNLNSADTFDWEKSPYEKQNFQDKYYQSILSAAETYETLGLLSKAIETYKLLISEYEKSEPGRSDHNNKIRQAALRLIALEPDQKHQNLKYYDIATAIRYLEHNTMSADLQLLQEELQAINDYIGILESTEYRSSKTKSELEEIDMLLKSKYLSAKELITEHALTSFSGDNPENRDRNVTSWIAYAEIIERFKAFALFTKVYMFMSMNNIKAATATVLALERELPKVDWQQRIEILLSLIEDFDILELNQLWLRQADQLQDKLLNSKDPSNFLKLIKLAELHAKNNNLERVKEIFELCMQKLPKIPDAKNLGVYSALQNIFKNEAKIPEQEILRYNIILCKYAIDNFKSDLTISEISELEYFRANLGLAKYLKQAETNYPDLITEIEQQLKINLHDSIYWYREVMNIFAKFEHPQDKDINEYYALCEAKFSQASDAYKEKLEKVLGCDLIGAGSIVFSPVSIPIKMNGKLVTKTYNYDARLNSQLLNDAYQTLTVERDKGFYFQSVKLNNALVHLVDPSTRQPISANMTIGHPSTTKVEDIPDEELPHATVEPIVQAAIAKTLIPNKLLANLIDYILRSEVINVADFPGFINPETGKRFIEPWLTKAGDTVEKDDSRAYCQNTKALEIMQQFPNIKELLETAKENFAKKQDQAALSSLLMAIDQAKTEENQTLSTAATRLLVAYISKSSNPIFSYIKIDKENSTILMVDAILKTILDPKQYTTLKSIIACPISLECAINPLTTSSGNTYESKAITLALETKNRDPLTNKKIDTTLIPNKAIASVLPWIITQAANNKPISLADLPVLKNAQGDFYKNPWLTENGDTVEHGNPKAKYPNIMLKQLIEHANPKSHDRLKM